MDTDKKYIVIANCDPYHSRFHYRGQRVLKYDMTSPIKWVCDDNYCEGYSYDEAKDILRDIVITLTDYSDNGGYYKNNVLIYQDNDESFRYDTMLYYIEEFDINSFKKEHYNSLVSAIKNYLETEEDMEYEINQALKNMDEYRCPLSMANETLYDAISDFIDDWKQDNEELANVYDVFEYLNIDVEELFFEVLK